MRIATLLGVALALGQAHARAEAEDVLIYHSISTDAGGILPWNSPDPSVAYDRNVRLVWSFWKTIRNDPNGVPYYLQHQVWKENEDDVRGLGGDQINMALSSWNLLYGYLGDDAVKANMVQMATYWLAHGLSKSTDAWADLPYPYNTELHSGVYDGDMMAGKGFLQPDKAANFGAELVTLFKMTGNRHYLESAARIADTLANKVVPGDEVHSPWPFRVNASDNVVYEVTKNGETSRAAYTAAWSGALRLFESLIELKQPNSDSYKRAHSMVTQWMKAFPMKTNSWGPFFEDIDTWRLTNTEINADTFAQYILERRQAWDPAWKAQAKALLDWSYATFRNDGYARFGVTPINEQIAYKVPGNSHTSRHASVELLYCEETGDCGTRPAAIRRLNWATYMVDEDGKNRYPRDDIWLTDGYGDYVRHYLRAMAACPELAPNDQNHLLRTSSVLQTITYGDEAITYAKYDAVSHERFKLGAWAPAGVEPFDVPGAQFAWNPKTRVLEVDSTERQVTIRRLMPK
jgi:hypothetical protein